MFAGKYKGNKVSRYKKGLVQNCSPDLDGVSDWWKKFNKGFVQPVSRVPLKVTAPAYLNVELRKIKSLSKTPNNKQNVSPREKRKFPIFTGPAAKLCSDWKTRESPPPTENSLTNSTFSQKKWTKCCWGNKNCAYEVEPGSKPPRSSHEQEPSSRMVILVHIILILESIFCSISSDGGQALKTGGYVGIKWTPV